MQSLPSFERLLSETCTLFLDTKAACLLSYSIRKLGFAQVKWATTSLYTDLLVFAELQAA